MVVPGNRPEDRAAPRVIDIPKDIEKHVARLPKSIVRRVYAEFATPDQQEVLEMLACYGIESHETGQSHICSIILDRAHGYKHGVRELVITAKSDWRNLLR